MSARESTVSPGDHWLGLTFSQRSNYLLGFVQGVNAADVYDGKMNEALFEGNIAGENPDETNRRLMVAWKALPDTQLGKGQSYDYLHRLSIREQEVFLDGFIRGTEQGLEIEKDKDVKAISSFDSLFLMAHDIESLLPVITRLYETDANKKIPERVIFPFAYRKLVRKRESSSEDAHEESTEESETQSDKTNNLKIPRSNSSWLSRFMRPISILTGIEKKVKWSRAKKIEVLGPDFFGQYFIYVDPDFNVAMFVPKSDRTLHVLVGDIFGASRWVECDRLGNKVNDMSPPKEAFEWKINPKRIWFQGTGLPPGRPGYTGKVLNSEDFYDAIDDAWIDDRIQDYVGMLNSQQLRELVRDQETVEKELYQYLSRESEKSKDGSPPSKPLRIFGTSNSEWAQLVRSVFPRFALKKVTIEKLSNEIHRFYTEAIELEAKNAEDPVRNEEWGDVCSRIDTRLLAAEFRVTFAFLIKIRVIQRIRNGGERVHEEFLELLEGKERDIVENGINDYETAWFGAETRAKQVDDGSVLNNSFYCITKLACQRASTSSEIKDLGVILMALGPINGFVDFLDRLLNGFSLVALIPDS